MMMPIAGVPPPGLFIDPVLPAAFRRVATRYVIRMAVKVVMRQLYCDKLGRLLSEKLVTRGIQ